MTEDVIPESRVSVPQELISPDQAIQPGAAGWVTGKPHISFSELALWMDCAFHHKLVHIDKKGTHGDDTPHLGFGTGCHDANENYIMTRKMDKAIAHDSFARWWADHEELFTKGPFPEWSPKGFGVLDDWHKKIDVVLDCVPAFLDAEFPGWECHSAEELLYETIADHPIKFKGMVDAVIKVPGPKGKYLFWIIDWKTCGWGWPREKQQDFKVHLQLVLYKAYWSKKHGIDPKDVRCGFALMKRDGKAGKALQLLPISVGPTTAAKGLKVIDNHIRSVSKGMFIKNRNSCRFCEFEDTPDCPQNF